MTTTPPFKLALVTGASSGIGEALCYLLADRGINLIISARNKANLHHLADRLRTKVNVVVYPADLSKPEERRLLVRKMHELHPDLVINNAGFGIYGLSTELDTQMQVDLIEVNCTALTELSIEAAKAMEFSGTKGVILNVSSVAGFMPFPYFAVYGATKAYATSYSQALDEEMRPKGIRCLVSCPGQVWTNFSLRASGGNIRRKDESFKMSPQFAAMEIWKQLEKRKPVHTFNWKYRAIELLVKYVLPHRLLMWGLNRTMRSRVRTF
ncbi:MAG: SDR family NAD(P)-dependent oxidoreductase [Chlamydiia bacterium]|nr:SDR family NAD(P)-dependent oxidoreductase [Chlamydiia bacterium]